MTKKNVALYHHVKVYKKIPIKLHFLTIWNLFKNPLSNKNNFLNTSYMVLKGIFDIPYSLYTIQMYPKFHIIYQEYYFIILNFIQNFPHLLQ